MYVIPLIYSGYLSLFASRLIDGNVFAGFDNYVRALQDTHFWAGLARVGLFVITAVPISLTIAVALSLALDSGKVHGAGIVRLGMFIPYAVPGVVAALLWGYIYGHDFGLITQLVHGIGLPAPDLLSSSSILGSIINVTFWELIGYNVIVLFSALRAIPADLFDAAAVDGASQWRIAWSIKLPALRPAIGLTVIFSLIGAFQLFNEPNLFGLLAPAAIGSDFTPNLYAFNVAFQNQDVNYAAAISFLLGVITVLVSYVVQLIIAKRDRPL